MAAGPEETLVSGYWPTVAQRSLWMKMLRKKKKTHIDKQSMHISKKMAQNPGFRHLEKGI
jgi:hypothetical protein